MLANAAARPVLISRSKVIITVLLVLMVAASFLTPVENRYFLLVIPLVMFFELELSRVLGRLKR